MKRIRRRYLSYTAWMGSVLFMGTVVTPSAFAQVTVGSLADELSDRDSLTRFPMVRGAYTLHQASSHDTRNGTEFGSDLGGAWGFLNADFGNYLRKEINQGRQELVMFEDTGPGAIIRWWSTGGDSTLLSNGKLRVYINGGNRPVLTRSASTLMTGDNMGFGPALNFATPDLGGNLYGPITYSSGVKVTWDGQTTHGRFANIREYVANGGTKPQFNNLFFYNINYRKYSPGTVVEPYTGNSTRVYAAELSHVNGRLNSTAVHGHVGSTFALTNRTVPNGSSVTRSFVAPYGARNGQAIREIKLSFNGKATPNHGAALKGTFLELTFDGQQTARVPVGQFFGNGNSENDRNIYNDSSDYFRTVSNGTLISRWVMPYQNRAGVRLSNESGEAVNIDLEIKTGDYAWTNSSMHFHADYRAEDHVRTAAIKYGDIPSKGFHSAEGDADFRFIDIRGRGVYVGDTMSIRNRSIGQSQHPSPWWGEGDEKIYIDYLNAQGDGSSATPEHLGTGTEDYYGYSWASSTRFSSPFVNQPISTAQNDHSGTGLTVNSRVRGLDAIPFMQSFKFDMEVWKWRQGAVDLAAATFWYGAPGTASMRVAAELATDFKRHTRRIRNGASAEGIADTAGDGVWTFLSAGAVSDETDTDTDTDLDTDDTDAQVLTWGRVGNAGGNGFGGGEHGAWNIPAISAQFLFTDGDQNIGIQGRPGYHELALHPSGGDGTQGKSVREFLVARWETGASSAGLININGSVRNLIKKAGDSIDFHILVNGDERFSVLDAGGSTLPETYFDFDTTVEVGDHVDFVVGNGPGIDPWSDEALLRATILSLGHTRHSVESVD